MSRTGLVIKRGESGVDALDVCAGRKEDHRYWGVLEFPGYCCKNTKQIPETNSEGFIEKVIFEVDLGRRVGLLMDEMGFALYEQVHWGRKALPWGLEL